MKVLLRSLVLLLCLGFGAWFAGAAGGGGEPAGEPTADESAGRNGSSPIEPPQTFADLEAIEALPGEPRFAAPRAWDDARLATWALPLAGLGEPPGHASSAQYYAAPIENLRTYPVYHPDHEPPGYWEWLQGLEPEPLIEVGRERTVAEWVAAGERVFDELDVPGFRIPEPEIIAEVRSAEGIEASGAVAEADGTVFKLRWVVTEEGVQLGIQDCAGCHSKYMPDGSRLPGAAFNRRFSAFILHHLHEGTEAFFPGDSPQEIFGRLYDVPWVEDDVHRSLRDMDQRQLGALFDALPPGTFARANGSPFYPHKVPDIRGIRHESYFDLTATRRHRGPGDLMRYAALVSYADKLIFGPHQFYDEEQRRFAYRLADDALLAIALYLYSLEPPPSPHPVDGLAARGRELFEREGCSSCHVPPHYRSDKLTPAVGFQPPEELHEAARVSHRSVGTHPGLAMRTRKGTGLYKVPSLRGLWYRDLLLHDGALGSLEEMFDPARMRDEFVPSGFRGPGVERRAVHGHEFGLDLSEEDRRALIAFLRTL